MNSYSSSLVSTSFKFVFASSRSFWFSPHSRTKIFPLNYYFRFNFRFLPVFLRVPIISLSVFVDFTYVSHTTLFRSDSLSSLVIKSSKFKLFLWRFKSNKPVFQFRVWFLVEQCSLLDLFYLFVREYFYHHLDFIIT